MALQAIAAAFSMIVAVQTPASMPAEQIAPAAPPEARYCLRVDPVTGSRMETIRCETRATWAWMEVDVDKEWATEGVRVES